MIDGHAAQGVDRKLFQAQALPAERDGEPGGHTARYWPDYYGWGRQGCREF